MASSAVAASGRPLLLQPTQEPGGRPLLLQPTQEPGAVGQLEQQRPLVLGILVYKFVAIQ